MDFITNLNTAISCPFQADFTSTMVADIFINNIIKLHGVPYLTITEKDQTFTSKFWQHLFHGRATLGMFSAKHPHSDG